MSADVVRWVIMFACLGNIGATAALLARLGNHWLPRRLMEMQRLLFVANFGWMISTIWIVYHRLGDPVSFRHMMLGFSGMLEAFVLIGIWVWYGTPKGRAYAARMGELARETDGP